MTESSVAGIAWWASGRWQILPPALLLLLIRAGAPSLCDEPRADPERGAAQLVRLFQLRHRRLVFASDRKERFAGSHDGQSAARLPDRLFEDR